MAGRSGEADRLGLERIGVLGTLISAGGANEHWEVLSSLSLDVMAAINEMGREYVD